MTKTALVTGATSGLGFESAAMLADQGYDVIVTGRTESKAADAAKRLNERTGKDVFRPVAVDLGHLDTVEAAAAAVDNAKIDFLLLNAGIAPTKDLSRTPDGIEATMAASLVGHHLLTMKLLETGSLAESARIVIAGSEAARGDVPTFSIVDVDGFAAANFSGHLEPAVETLLRMDPPAEYDPGDTYATAKLFVAWWAQELAKKLPQGMTVNAVSPGSTPGTEAARNAPFFMKYLLMPVFKLVPGMSHGIQDGAGRYLEAAGYGDEVTGKFFASKPKKMTGPLAEITLPQFQNPAGASALWNVVTKVAGGVGYPAVN